MLGLVTKGSWSRTLLSLMMAQTSSCLHLHTQHVLVDTRHDPRYWVLWLMEPSSEFRQNQRPCNRSPMGGLLKGEVKENSCLWEEEGKKGNGEEK